MEEKVSIVVPIYNQEKYLHKSIQSLLNQKYQNLEMILVNDGSTDSSLCIIEDYSKRDRRIKFYTKPNGGLVDATIYGVERATGEYIAFLDPDDYIGPEYISNFILAMEDDIDFVASGFYRDNNGKITHFQLKQDKKYIGDDFCNLKHHYLLDRNDIEYSNEIFVSRWNKLYRSSVVKEVIDQFKQFKDVTLGEDTIFTYILLSKARGCKALVGPNEYFYNVGNQNSMMVNNSIQRHLDKTMTAFQGLRSLLTWDGVEETQAYAIYFFEMEALFRRLMNADKVQFRKLYYALREDPIYREAFRLFKNHKYPLTCWFRIFGRNYFPAFFYRYVRLQLKSDMKKVKSVVEDAKFICNSLWKKGGRKTYYAFKFKKRRDRNFDEIERYLPIIDARIKEWILAYDGEQTDFQKSPITKNVFLFWWDGFESAPRLVNACKESVQKFFNECDIHLIDKKNYTQYTDIDERILNDFNKGKISIQVFSDILRFNLLKNNGGIWIDSTIMFLDRMNLIDHLENKPIDSLEFSTSRNFMQYEGMSCSWSGYFFASRKNSLFVNVVDEVFREYYLKYKDYSTYFFIDMVLMTCKKYGLDGNALDHTFYRDGDMSFMLRTLKEDYNPNFLSQYKRVPQKLAWGHKKCSSENSNYSYYIENYLVNIRGKT